MIKVHKHLLTCECADCVAMFPSRRFEAVWVAERPEGPAVRAVGHVPIGHARPALEVGLWVALTPDDRPGRLVGRLAADWPGFPGTLGAHVELAEGGPDEHPRVVRTNDPILAALAPPVPLRRALVDRFNARSMVEHGLADLASADLIPCDRHGHGVSALTCACLVAADAASPPLEVVLVYGLDGDYPDLFCDACFRRYAGGDVDVCVPVCSRCQQERVYRHAVAATTWYGA